MTDAADSPLSSKSYGIGERQQLAADRAEECATIVTSSYLAIPVEQVAELMRAVGFEAVRRLDDRFFQPVLVGTRPVV